MSSIIYIIITSVITVVAAILIVIFLYKSYKYLFTKSTLIGNTLTSRLIILSITCSVFRNFFDVLFVQPFVLLFDILTQVGKSFYDIISKNKSAIDFLSIVNLISGISSSFINFFRLHLLTFNFFSGFVFAVILHIVIKAVFYDSVTKEYILNPRLKSYLVGTTLAYTIRQNIALFFLLMGSLYLVYCAMVSISYNSNTISLNAGTGTSQSLTDSLKLPLTPTNTLLLSASINSQDSLAINKIIQSKPDSSLSKIAKGILSLNISNIKSHTDYSYRLINQTIARYNIALQDFRDFQENKIIEIQNKVNGNDLPKQLFDNYKNDVTDWFSQGIEYDISNLQVIQKQINQSVNSINSINSSIKNGYDSFIATLSKVDDNTTLSDNFYNYFTPLFVNYYPSDIDFNSFNNSLNDLKPPPKRGSEWGVLGSSTSWLTSTQSIDLILIVGMFGFGFLGSAISSFVNAQENINANKPIVDNLSVVIIRGFSAAIVIFLATKGGIAVVNNGTNEPNPYVLFFSCLIGAVYSERIWDWARDQIKSRYNAQDDKQQKEASPQQGNLQQSSSPVK